MFLPVAEAPKAVPPRARIGALAVPVLSAFERLGFFPGGREWIAAAIHQLKARRDQLSQPDNEAQSLARALAGTMPLVYGAGNLGRAAGLRWKDQINQTAKSPSWTGVLPDVVHGEMAGWGQHGDITRQVLSLVLLRHDEEHPRQAERYRALETMLEEVVGAVHQVEAEGDGALAQILDLVLYGDVVSLELAGQEGLDPGPVPAVDDLARMLEA